MKRVALMLSVLVILFVAVGAAQAHGYHRAPKYRHHYGHVGPVVIPPRVLIAPRVYVPAPPPVVYRQAPCYRYYVPAPSFDFYYRGRGLSFGFGF